MSNPIPTTPNLRAYWKADAGLYQDAAGTTPAAADGDPVGLWQDQSGNGFHLSQSAAGQRPGLTPATPYKSRPGVSFDAAGSQYLSNAAFRETSGVSAGTVVVAFYRPNTSQSQGVFGPDKNCLGVYDSAGDLTAMFDQGNYQFTAYKDKCYHGKLVVLRYDGGQAAASRFDYRVNRTSRVKYGAASGNDPDAVTPVVAAGLSVGRSGYPSAGPGYLTGTVLEAAYFSRKLTDAEVAAIEQYYADAYFARGERHVWVGGDSIPRGYPLHNTDGQSWPEQMAGLLGPPYAVGPIASSAVVAYQTAQLESTWASAVDPDRDEWRAFDLVVLESGTNDLAANRTAAQAVADMTTAVTNRHAKGYLVAVQTLLPREDTGDFSNAQTQSGFDAARAAYNASVLNGDTGADYVFDLAGTAGWAPPVDGNPNFYSGDLCHLSDAGTALAAQDAAAFVRSVAPASYVPGAPALYRRRRVS